jgi:predicted GIY-YIG superfamily endonuclease
MVEQAYVYIMASSFQRLYIGVTTEIEVRISQHKNCRYPQIYVAIQNRQARLLRAFRQNPRSHSLRKAAKAMIPHQNSA